MNRRKMVMMIARTGRYGPTQYIFDGDSLTVSGAPTGYNSYPDRFMASRVGIDWTNYAVSGQGITDVTADAASQVDPTYTNNRNAVVMLWIGANDYCSTDPTVLYSAIVAYHAGRRSRNHKTAVFTVMQRGDLGNHEADRATLNGLIRANWTTFADYLVDVAADARLQTITDTVYFQADQVHLTPVGYAVAAEIANSAGLPANTNLLTNPGFEIAGTPTFLGWSESNKSDGTIGSTTTAGEFHGGTTAAKITTGASHTCAISQEINVIPGKIYNLSFWVKGQASGNPYYSVLDVTHGYAGIISQTTTPTGTDYNYVTASFTAPAGCLRVALNLMSQWTTGRIACFDDVSILMT